jgi:MFS family permease
VAFSGAPMTASAPFQLFLLAIAMAAGGYARTAISPLQEAMQLNLGLTDNQMALLQGPAVGIPLALTAIPLGLLVDRYSRVRLLTALILLSSLGSLLTVFAAQFTALLLTRALAGVAGLSTVPVVYSLISDLYAPARRGRATTIICVGQLAGMSGAFALGGALLAMAGPGSDHWPWAMGWLVVPLLPAAALMLALREPPRVAAAAIRLSPRQICAELWALRATIGPLAAGVIMVEGAVGAIFIWATPMLSRSFQLTPNQIGTIMAVGTLVSGIVGPVVAGTLADFTQRTGGPRRTMYMLAALTFVCAPVSLFAFVTNIALASTLLVVSLTLLLAVAIIGMILFTVVIPSEIRGLCLSILIAANLLSAFAIGPVIVSLMSAASAGPGGIGKSLSVTCVAVSLCVSACFAYGGPYVPRKAAVT